jgi:hypothetical protein
MRRVLLGGVSLLPMALLMVAPRQAAAATCTVISTSVTSEVFLNGFCSITGAGSLELSGFGTPAVYDAAGTVATLTRVQTHNTHQTTAATR